MEGCNWALQEKCLEKLNIYKLIGCVPDDTIDVILSRCCEIRGNCEIGVCESEQETKDKQQMWINAIIMLVKCNSSKRMYDVHWRQNPTFAMEAYSKNYKVCVIL